MASGRITVHILVSKDPHSSPSSLHSLDPAAGTLTCTPYSVRQSPSSLLHYHFSHLYSPDFPRSDLVRGLGVRLIRQFTAGKSCAVIAYGQAGTGKTQALYGGSESGLIREVIKELLPRNCSKLTLSAVCFYQDQAISLLSPSPKDIKSLDEAQQALSQVLLSSPKLAASPSRAHSVVTLSRPEGGAIYWVDLAGMERVRGSWVNETYIEEAKHINRSLEEVGKWMKGGRGRGESKLVQALQEKLSKVYVESVSELHLLLTISPKSDNFKDTFQSLQLAQELVPAPPEPGPPARQTAMDKEAKMLILESDREELREQAQGLILRLEKARDKNRKLKGENEDLRKRVSQLESALSTSEQGKQSELQREFRSQSEAADGRRELEMAEFRAKAASEANQNFATRIQELVTEHERTVGKMMHTLMERQKQEHKLISLIQREKEKNRRLTAQVQSGLAEVQEEGAFPHVHEDAAVQCLSYSVDAVEDCVQTSRLPSPELREERSEGSEELNGIRGDNEIPATPRDVMSVRFEDESVSSSLFLSVFQFAFPVLSRHTPVLKLNSRARPQQRQVWIESFSDFLLHSSSPATLSTRLLRRITVLWTTTSRLKRRFETSFELGDVQTISTGQSGPLFSKNHTIKDKAERSLWVIYRKTQCLSVIFGDRETMLRWGCALILAVLLINNPREKKERWGPVVRAMVEGGGMPGGVDV